MLVLMPAIAMVAESVWGPEPRRMDLILPVPGDLRGVAECVAAVGSGVALWRPGSSGAPGVVGLPGSGTEGLHWVWAETWGTPVPVALYDARRELRLAILDCGRELTDLDVARDDGGRIVVEEAERSLAQLRLPRSMPSEQVALLRDGVRLLAAVRWALGTSGSAVSASAAVLRHAALARLERAAREAIEASTRAQG